MNGDKKTGGEKNDGGEKRRGLVKSLAELNMLQAIRLVILILLVIVIFIVVFNGLDRGKGPVIFTIPVSVALLFSMVMKVFAMRTFHQKNCLVCDRQHIADPS